MKLDIGCGKTKLENDWEGLDIVDYGQKYVLDLEKDGLKGIPDKSITEIKAHNVFEHLSVEKRLFVFNECWRVLVSRGTLDIKVPCFPHGVAVNDPSHKSFYSKKMFFDYFAGNRPRNSIIYDHKGNRLQKWATCRTKDGLHMYSLTDGIIRIKLSAGIKRLNKKSTKI